MSKHLSSGLRQLALLCAALMFVATSVSAQSQATTGNIEGQVLDPQGAVVPDASVTATSQQTGLQKEAVVDEDGNYRVILLPPGTYTVRASGQGFAPTELRDVTVNVGGKTALDINLTVGGTSESITVSDEAPVVETTRTSVSSTINQRAIENLPVNGRNYLDFATLTPGVIRDPTRQGDLSVGGQKGTLNSLQVDGTDNNNTFFGQALGRTGTRPPYQFSEESVQEFQVNQNGFSAEFGRSGGAVINVVTKSGTNEFHGGAFEYFRDESLNANASNVKSAFTPTGQPRPNIRPKLQINQFGGRIGGPIKKDRAFFFFTYDGQRSDQPNILEADNTFLIPNTGLGADLLSKLNPYEVSRNQDVVMAKTDISLNQSNQLSVRFNHQNFTGVNNENGGPLSVEEHSGDSIAKTTTLSGTLASTFSPQLVNEFRFQFARDKEPGTANSDTPEALIGTGVGTRRLSIGRNNFSPRETTIKRVQFIDNISYVTGRHIFKGGVDLNFDRIFNFFPGLFGGQYTFNSYADFINNRPARFVQNFGGEGTSGGTTEPDLKDYAVFFQDDWRVTPRLTLNLGVRYDYQDLAAPPVQNPDPALLARGFDTSRQPKDKDNLAPRAGFAYDVAGDGKTVIRGGYGIFYGRTPAIILGTAHSQNGINVTGVSLNCTTTATNPCPTYPNVFTAPPGGLAPPRPTLYLFAENYQQPYVQQGRLGVERELFANTSLSVTYLFFKGVKLTRTRDVNLSAPVPATATFDGETFTIDRFPAARPLVNYTRINLFESSANSEYHGLATQLTRRFSNQFQFIMSYTYSKAEDDKPDQTSVVPGNAGDDSKLVQNFLNLREDYGTSDLDLRHRFVFSPVYDTGRFESDNAFLRALLSDYNFSGIVQLQSGVAYSATANGDQNRDGNSFNDRTPGTARNEFRTPNTYQFDARVTRMIPFNERMRLRLILEGFNIFNRSNVIGVNTGLTNFSTPGGTPTFSAPAANFGLPRAFLTERQLQLAIKFDF